MQFDLHEFPDILLVVCTTQWLTKANSRPRGACAQPLGALARHPRESQTSRLRTRPLRARARLQQLSFKLLEILHSCYLFHMTFPFRPFWKPVWRRKIVVEFSVDETILSKARFGAPIKEEGQWKWNCDLNNPLRWFGNFLIRTIKCKWINFFHQ